MSVAKLYGGRYLNAEAVPEEPAIHSIVGVRVGKPDDNSNKQRVILSLRGIDEELILNQTNALALAAGFGDDETRWLGKEITVFRGLTTFKNERVSCIVVAPLTENQTAEA